MNGLRLRSVGVAVAAVALSAAVTGCQKGGTASGAGSVGKPSAPASSAPATEAPATEAPAAEPTSPPAPKPTVKPVAKLPTKPAGKPAATPTAYPVKKPGSDCATAAPNPDHYDPDEIALYRIEELPGSTGKVNLVFQHGAWGCGSPDSDGAPFVVSGEEARWAMDQAAYVTATNPIIPSTENKRIGVQELIDWVKAHPNSGLVFRYDVGGDGSIDSLQEVFTP